MGFITGILGLLLKGLAELSKVYLKKPIKETEVYRDIPKERFDKNDDPFNDSDW